MDQGFVNQIYITFADYIAISVTLIAKVSLNIILRMTGYCRL